MTGTVPEQLEALGVQPGDGSTAILKLSGALSVTGTDRNFTIALDTGSAKTSIAVHTPGASPLTKLDGAQVALETTLADVAGSSLFLADTSGPLYLAVFGDGPALAAAEERLGQGFVRRGDEVASKSDGTFIWSYRKAVFKTDDGDVTLSPGEVKTVRIGGVTWRAVVSASYQVSTDPDASELPGCSPESLLGFELLRLSEAPATEEAPLKRDQHMDAAFAGCFLGEG
ncbi:MAG: hypothetical protein QM820_33070 [Minicystis sp.]